LRDAHRDFPRPDDPIFRDSALSVKLQVEHLPHFLNNRNCVRRLAGEELDVKLRLIFVMDDAQEADRLSKADDTLIGCFGNRFNPCYLMGTIVGK
jgi:hypothetical protein